MINQFAGDARNLVKRWHLREKQIRAGRERRSKNYYIEHDILTRKLNKLQAQFDVCLEAAPHLIGTSTVNSFLDALIVGLQPISKRSLMKIDSYYLKACRCGIRLDVITFNTLLKAVRLTQPKLPGGLAAAYLNEMHTLNIDVDAFTVNELLCMAARNPNHTSYDRVHSNKWVADQEFKYYLSSIYRKKFSSRCPSAFVLNSYLNVYAQDGDFEGMKKVLRIAKEGGIFWKTKLKDSPLDTTFQKGIQNWVSKRGFPYLNTSKISIYDYFS